MKATQGEIRVGVTAVELRRLPAADRAHILQAQIGAELRKTRPAAIVSSDL